MKTKIIFLDIDGTLTEPEAISRPNLPYKQSRTQESKGTVFFYAREETMICFRRFYPMDLMVLLPVPAAISDVGIM